MADLKIPHANQAALHIAANPEFHEPTKHTKINFHVVCEKL